MPTISINFTGGTQPPAKLGTLILKQASQGRASYTQNIDVQNDEYGNGVAVPGPALNTITDNATFTGVPYLKTLWVSSSQNAGFMYVVEGLLGATNKIRRIKDVEAGETPVVDTTGGDATVTHSGHSGVEVTDIVTRENTSYIVGKDATDGWVQSFGANSASITPATVTTLSTFTTARVPKMIVLSDNKLYIGHGFQIDSINTNDVYANLVLDIPRNYGVTELAEWQLNLLIAYNTDQQYIFNQRKSGGRSGIVIWNTTASSFQKDIPCPARFISAVVNDPDGSLLVFGGLDEGKTTIYQFNGYGFTPLYTYIGDMPHSRHSVDFDGQGRVMWITADGQICRYDKINRIFEHLGTITTASSAGGFFTKLVGGTGNEFLASSGSDSTYICKRVSFGSFIGDGGGTDTVTTPLAVGPLISIPPRSRLQTVTPHLQKDLASGEKIEFRLYKNGSTSYSTIGTLDFSLDGARASKTIRPTVSDIDNFAIGAAWKMTDASATAPGLISCDIDFHPLKT